MVTCRLERYLSNRFHLVFCGTCSFRNLLGFFSKIEWVACTVSRNSFSQGFPLEFYSHSCILTLDLYRGQCGRLLAKEISSVRSLPVPLHPALQGSTFLLCSKQWYVCLWWEEGTANNPKIKTIQTAQRTQVWQILEQV